MKPNIFIDGNSGTTGLKITERLSARTDLKILEIDPLERKNPEAKKKIYREADVVILCLPDEAAIEAAKIIGRSKTKIIDASTAHRVTDGWVYGLPEIYFPKQYQKKKMRKMIMEARCVSVPGCYATGFALCVNPLANSGLIDTSMPIYCTAITGYSGGGKKMIAEYKSYGPERRDDVCCRPKNLDGNHKHLPEMKKYSFLDCKPSFSAIVGNFYQGMTVHVSISNPKHDFLTPAKVRIKLKNAYCGEKFIKIINIDEIKKIGDGFPKSIENLKNTNKVRILVAGRAGYVNIFAFFDNLGKGSSGAAVQNLNLMLGLPETSGLL